MISLIALDIKKGDNVICVANAGFYSSAAILSVGAIPNYVDVDWKSMNMDANLIENAVKEILADGLRTGDIMEDGRTQVTTEQMGDAILEKLNVVAS